MAREHPARVQEVRRELRARERPLLLIAPAPADEHAALRGLVRVPSSHDVDAHRRLAIDAVVDALEPAIEPTQLEGVEIDGGIGLELRVAGVAETRAAVGPGADDEPLQTLL